MQRAAVEARPVHQRAGASREAQGATEAKGIALAPPAYGVDFVDRAATGSGGLPAKLHAGVEALSGFDVNDVRVQRDSPRPAAIGALAFTQGTEIHLGPGQERHLPHEAWHVVQQKQGRVRATLQAKGVGINDDPGMEREADAMGARAAHGLPPPTLGAAASDVGGHSDSAARWPRSGGSAPVIQRVTPLQKDKKALKAAKRRQAILAAIRSSRGKLRHRRSPTAFGYFAVKPKKPQGLTRSRMSPPAWWWRRWIGPAIPSPD